jgi:hypothetical protein
VSTYQYYEFLAIDRPLDERQQAEVRALSTRARITATSFTNEYHWGDFRGDPRTMMERYYDAHLYLSNWGTHQVMLRLPRSLLDLKTVESYCAEPHATAWTTREHLILDLTSQDESGDWIEGAEDSLSAIASVRAELAAGALRPLYLAWLAGYGAWERDEGDFNDDEEDELEPPVPAGLGSLTAPQRALADFLRLDADLLTIAAQASPPLAVTRDDPRKLANWIKDLLAEDTETFLLQVAEGHGARVQMDLLRRFRGSHAIGDDGCPRRTVAQLLNAAAGLKLERRRQAEAAHAAEEARREGQRALAREKRLDALTRDKETAWVRVEDLIDTRKQDNYDAAVELLEDLREVAACADRLEDFTHRFTRLCRRHLRKPTLIARFDRAGFTAAPDGQ